MNWETVQKFEFGTIIKNTTFLSLNAFKMS